MFVLSIFDHDGQTVSKKKMPIEHSIRMLRILFWKGIVIGSILLAHQGFGEQKRCAPCFVPMRTFGILNTMLELGQRSTSGR